MLERPIFFFFVFLQRVLNFVLVVCLSLLWIITILLSLQALLGLIQSNLYSRAILVSLLRSFFSGVFTEYSRCSLRSLYSSWLQLNNSNCVQVSGGVQSAAPQYLFFPPQLLFVQTHGAYARVLVFSQILMRFPVKLSRGLPLCSSLLPGSLSGKFQLPKPPLVFVSSTQQDSHVLLVSHPWAVAWNVLLDKKTEAIQGSPYLFPFSQQMSEICENGCFIYFVQFSKCLPLESWSNICLLGF